MREIRFRAWDPTNQVMEYNVNVNQGKPVKRGYQWFNTGNTVYRSELQQYTGLKDKNGKDIFEGDIVKVSEEYGGHAYTPLVVDFKDCCFVLRRINYMSDYNPMFKYDFTQVYEVLGNIYENPELLEQTP